LRELLARFVEWSQGLGPWGPFIVAIAYVPACILFIPGIVLTLAAGFAFGVVRASMAVSLGSTVGATAAFLIGRRFARGFIEKRLAAYPRFHAIDRAVEKEGFKIVLLTRLCPAIPFTLLNYAMGLTKVELNDFIVASWIGMLPATILFCYLGSALHNLAEAASGHIEKTPAQRALFWLGLLSAVLLSVLLTRIATKALKEAAPDA
jgi:uncharacterized membrane protein YdjX (TVP38/TMEM64 family)